MNTSKSTIKINPTRAIAAAALAGVIGLLGAAPASAQPLPTYATGTADETIQGTISAINGPYNISVRDSRGFIDNVGLHQGTIINPTGLTLEPGFSVTILGRNDGKAFTANEIDTPYQTLAAVPVYPVYGYSGYPYWGPSYDIGLRFGRGFGFGFRR
jgi:hypothetical protein